MVKNPKKDLQQLLQELKDLSKNPDYAMDIKVDVQIPDIPNILVVIIDKQTPFFVNSTTAMCLFEIAKKYDMAITIYKSGIDKAITFTLLPRDDNWLATELKGC